MTEYTVTFQDCVIEVYNVSADTEEEAATVAESVLDDLNQQEVGVCIWTGTYRAEED